jgi:enoyl-CoA hydratase/carnithine racemase
MVFSADEMMASGFLRAVLPGADVKLDAQVRAQRLTTLAPQAARLNKQTLRRLVTSTAPLADGFAAEAYAYADSAEHREGINAFLSKRLPVF